MKALTKLIEKNPVMLNNNYSFIPEFNEIIKNKTLDYGKNKEALKSFLNDMQKGGCQSGMIGEFIYHADNKAFYIKHIDDLEEYKGEQEDNMGEPIPNRHSLPHYTFVVWLAFEEYCYELYNAIFE